MKAKPQQEFVPVSLTPMARCSTFLGRRSVAAGATGRNGRSVDPPVARQAATYSWLRAAQGRHADFWQVTGDALDFALETLGLAEPGLRERLMQLYLRTHGATATARSAKVCPGNPTSRSVPLAELPVLLTVPPAKHAG